MSVDNASRALSTSGEDWILFGDNTGILVGDAAGDEVGSSTALSTDGLTLAVSARINDDNGNNAGHVKIFRKADNAWSQIGESIEGESANDESGFYSSSSDDSNTVAIREYKNDGNGYNSGHVRVSSYNETS